MENQAQETVAQTAETVGETKSPEQLFAEESSGEIPQQAAKPVKEQLKEDESAKVAAPTYNRKAILERKQFAKLSAEKREMEQRLANIEKSVQRYDGARAKLADPSVGYDERSRILRDAMGVDLTDMAESFIKSGEPEGSKKSDPEVARVAAELKALKEMAEKKETEVQQQRMQWERNQYFVNAKKFVENNTDKYPLLDALDKSSAIVTEYERMDAAGEVDPDTTLDMVAEILEQRIESALETELKALLGKDKFKALLAKVGTENKPSKQSKAKSTLTNSMATAPKDEFDYSKASSAEIERYARKVFEKGN